MRLNLVKCLLLGALVTAPIGCEPRPVVVDPNDDETTIIEEGDVDVDRDVVPPPEPRSGVDVNVGGENGVDVDVNRDAANAPNQNP